MRLKKAATVSKTGATLKRVLDRLDRIERGLRPYSAPEARRKAA